MQTAITTAITTAELAQMDNAGFIEYIRQYPDATQWVDALALRYAAFRLARLQGLIIK